MTNSQSITHHLLDVVSAINKEIEYLANFSDVDATLLFRLDGKVLNAFYGHQSSQRLLIIIDWVKDIISKTMEQLRNGSQSVKYDKDIGEKEPTPVYFYRAGNSSILVTILDPRVNTGLMEIEMSRTARLLGWVIDGKNSTGV
jgi:predicted regulator of Ras-like GTPase activity (Roadblock/LC7/MglB family)